MTIFVLRMGRQLPWSGEEPGGERLAYVGLLPSPMLSRFITFSYYILLYIDAGDRLNPVGFRWFIMAPTGAAYE